MLAPMTLAAVLVAAGANASQPVSEQPVQCVDALVRATIVRQTPTVMPDCGRDCIVMSWPYIDRIDVKEVMRGKAPVGALTVLSVQHTYYLSRPGGIRWWLRRNTIGGYNVIRLGSDADPPRCSKNEPLAHAYITPKSGQTLEDVEKAGDAVFGHNDGPRPGSDTDD